ncbi:MAG: hypothetical protein WDO56_29195 [Gammaproteobacteria bacterium]
MMIDQRHDPVALRGAQEIVERVDIELVGLDLAQFRGGAKQNRRRPQWILRRRIGGKRRAHVLPDRGEREPMRPQRLHQLCAVAAPIDVLFQPGLPAGIERAFAIRHGRADYSS